MIKYKYRFKTEQEFVNEFGRDWRITVRCSFNESMDYLLGKEIDPCYYVQYIDNGRLDLSYLVLNIYDNVRGWTWHISEQMIKEVKTGVDYNTTKKLVYD